MRKPDRMSIAPLSALTLKCCPFCPAGKFLLILLQVLFMYMCIKCTLSCSSKNAVNSHFHSLRCSLYPPHTRYHFPPHDAQSSNSQYAFGRLGRQVCLLGNSHNGCSEPAGMEPHSCATYQPPAHKQNKQNAKLLTLFSYLGSSNISALGGCKWCCQFRI